MTLQVRYSASTPWGGERGGVLDEFQRRRPAWQQLAACRGMGTEAFFPEAGDDLEPARAICQACPVRRECATYAIEATEPILHGIWGGTSMVDRRRLRRVGA